MKGATQCAKKVKQVFKTLRSKLGKAAPLTVTDPIDQLILGIFSRDTVESRAADALKRLRAEVVDYNELRVIPAIEMAEMVGDFPDVRLKCEDLSRALNRIFAVEHTVRLEQLRGVSKRDQNAYLEGIDGLEAYTRARIRLLGLESHAIPMDEAMLAFIRKHGMVTPEATLDECHSFMERQISDKDAHEFVSLLRKQAWADHGAAVRKAGVERILSVPPDRTTRNMLQQVAAAAANHQEIVTIPQPPPEAAKGAEKTRGRKKAAKPATKEAETPPPAAKPKAKATKSSAKAKPRGKASAK